MPEPSAARRRGLYGRLQAAVARWLRVPPPPAVPAGSPGSVRWFQAAPGFLRYRTLHWGLAQVGAVWGLVAGFTMVGYVPEEVPFHSYLHWAELAGVAIFVLQLPLSYFLVRLDFENRWYLMTDRSLRIREGVLKVHEQTMSFANLQNLSIRQGPLQRLFGISDLQVRTAGGGGKADAGKGGDGEKKDPHLAFFRGVANAEAIRDLILGHLRRIGGSGLGDPDDEGPEPAPLAGGEVAAAGPADEEAIAAARELLAEAAALRESVRSGLSRGPGPGP